MTYLYYIVNNMAADDLETQRAKAFANVQFI